MTLSIRKLFKVRKAGQSGRTTARTHDAAKRRGQHGLRDSMTTAELAEVEVGERVLAGLSDKLREKLLAADLTFEMSDDPLCVQSGRIAAETLRDELAGALGVEDLEYLAVAMTARVGCEPVRTASLRRIICP